MSKSIVSTYDEGLNFWEAHPSYLLIPAFKKLYGRDRTKTKKRSSDIMWAMVFIYDTNDGNPWYNIALEDKKAELAEHLIGNKNFEWEKYEYVSEEIEKRVTTEPQRHRDALYDKMRSRQKFIQKTDYSFDEWIRPPGAEKMILKKGTVDQLDKMIANSVKLYDDLARIDKLIALEESKEDSKVLSESESGDI